VSPAVLAQCRALPVSLAQPAGMIAFSARLAIRSWSKFQPAAVGGRKTLKIGREVGNDLVHQAQM
jgi:hypothetical protein